jgi:hypothetical protein
MMQIFKYFVGIIGVLILVYVLLVVLRTVLTSGVSTGANIITDPAVQQNVASGTVSLVNAVGEFSLASWLRNFRPFAYAPLEVTTDVTDRATPRYYNDDLSRYNSKAWQENLNWQNLHEAPDNHPTDFVPVGGWYTKQLLESQNSVNSLNENGSEEEIEISDRYIVPATKSGSIVKDNSILTGRAYYKVFSQREFPIYILDERGNTVGSVTAYANGDIRRDETVPFRAVIDIDYLPIYRGFLMFKNENVELSQIKAVTVIPVLFAK